MSSIVPPPALKLFDACLEAAYFFGLFLYCSEKVSYNW